MNMMEKMMQNMSKEEMSSMMNKLMKECCADMTSEDKEKLAEEIKCGCCKEGEVPILPQKMMVMMPQCLKVLLPRLSKEDRKECILKMDTILFSKNGG